MKELCDLKVVVNGDHTFFLSQRIMFLYSGAMRRMVKGKGKGGVILLDDFPGGARGFEQAVRFCYSGGRIAISPLNVAGLHCAGSFLDMPGSLVAKTETFMDGLFYWTWDEILASLHSCEGFVSAAESSGILHKLIPALISKISASSDTPLTPSSSSSASSPDASMHFRRSSSTKTPTPDTIKGCLAREWWFDDLGLLSPPIIERIIRALGAYGKENKSFTVTRFLLYYLKSHGGGKEGGGHRDVCIGLADTAVDGVVAMGNTTFSCRGLFWVLRIVSEMGLSKDCRKRLERLIGLMLDQATLDDLLICGHAGAYDVGLVVRLVGVFVSSEDGGISPHKLRKVGNLLDSYLGEIAPDHSLKVSKFLAVAESLPDSARASFDSVYRALDIYLEAHPGLEPEKRAMICRCLNYEKLSLEASKDLAKNHRIPPRIAMQALVSQHPANIQTRTDSMDSNRSFSVIGETTRRMTTYKKTDDVHHQPEEKELRQNMLVMQNKVMELEKACREMRGQMSKMAKGKPVGSSQHSNRGGLPRLC